MTTSNQPAITLDRGSMGDEGHFVTIDDHVVFIRDDIGTGAKGKGGMFTRHALEKKLTDWHEAASGGAAAVDEKSFAAFYNRFTFAHELPEEVKRHIENNPATRRLFRVTHDVSQSGGADALGEMGDDRYFAAADRAAGSTLKAAKELAYKEGDPAIQFHAALHDDLGPGTTQTKQGIISTSHLRAGQTFSINGRDFKVEESAQGLVLNGGSDFPETPIAYLDRIPIDRHSLKAPKLRGAATRSEDIPFSRGLCLSTGHDEPGKAVPLGLEGYPAEIMVRIGSEPKKIPVSYFEKDALEVGSYKHPTTNQEFAVDERRMDMWVDKFHKMRAAGIEIPCPVDHSDKAEDNRGFTMKVRRDGGKLKFTPQVFGEDGALLALRNRCSVKINPNFIDEKKREWGEAIEHIAFTPVPVISGQGTFVPFAASRGGQTDTQTLYLSASKGDPIMDLTKLREAIGAGKDVADDDVIAQATAKLKEATPALELSRTQAANITTLTTRAETAEAKVLQLSKAPDPDILKDRMDLTVQKIDLCLSRGQCTKAQADILKGALKDGDKAAVLMLSKSGPDGTPIDTALKVLELNKPFTGTSSQLQPLPDPNVTADAMAAARTEAGAFQSQQLQSRGLAAT